MMQSDSSRDITDANIVDVPASADADVLGENLLAPRSVSSGSQQSTDKHKSCMLVAAKAWNACKSEFIWALVESGDLIVYVIGKILCQIELHSTGWPYWIRWNPLFWALLLACEVCMLAGHGFHALFRQGAMVRPDELVVERRVRIWWIYTYSGGFVSTTLLDIIIVLWEVPIGRVDRDQLLGYLLSIFISISYLLGNVNFLHQMRHRDTTMMHFSALAKIGYGIAFVVVFFIGVFYEILPGTKSTHSRVSEIAWAVRSMFAVVMILAVCGYRRILEFTYDDDVEAVSSTEATTSTWRRCKLVAIVGYGLYPIALVLIAFNFGGTQLWTGLTGF